MDPLLYGCPNPHDSTGTAHARALDVDLLEAWRNGDDRAGRTLLDRYSGTIVGFFKRKARKDAEDLAHTTFMRMLEGRDRVRVSGAFRAYALGIARNVLREHTRALARGRNVDPQVESIAQLAPGPNAVVSEREEHGLLLEGLRQLSVGDQAIVELFYWEGLDSNALGSMVGMPASSVRTRLSRARERLKQLMTELAASRVGHANTSDGLDEWAAELRGHVFADREQRSADQTTTTESSASLTFLGTVAGARALHLS